MKICHVAPIYLPGILPGCSKYVQDISKSLAGRGHSITVLTSNAITGRGWVDPVFGQYSPVKEETIEGVRVRRLKTGWPVTSVMHLLKMIGDDFLPSPVRDIVSVLSAGPYLTHLEEEFGEERYDVIHAAAFPFALIRLVQRACRSLGKPFVCTPLIHFEDPSHGNPLLWKALRNAASVIACSGYEREGMIRMGIDPSRIRLVPMGIDLEEWANLDGARFRRKYRLEGKKIILFAGTKNYNKGAIHLLQAMKGIVQNTRDAVLVAIGLATVEWKKEKGRAGETGLLDMGYVSEEEKRDAFDACDVFVMPSRYDSFGIVYLEAWRCGKPVIGARVGAIPEVIDNGKDGLLVEFGNIDALASAIRRLLENGDLRGKMGEDGRRKVQERFNWQKNISRIEKVFEGAQSEWR